MRGFGIVAGLVVLVSVAALAVAVAPEAGEGVLVASVGERVVVADPLGRWSHEFATGPVAWLFPAPGGQLFAPDLIGGRTTVIDLRGMTVAERFDGISMPWFGEQRDRYVAISNELLMMSYPERAILGSVPVTISRPWQVVLAANDTYVMVLERDPAGGPTVLTLADLAEGKVVFRRPTGGEVLHFALVPGGALALADVTARRVRLVRLATFEPAAEIDPGGRPVDVVVTAEGDLVTAAETAAGAGRVTRWQLKQRKHGLEVRLKKAVSLPSPPLRIALAIDGRRLAVATADGAVSVRDADSLEAMATIALGGAPRDLRWCDPLQPGPDLPEWSDQTPAGTPDERRLNGTR